MDLASVADGLKAEQEQGITIDVAYRYLDLNGRRLILADTPGHEQYTRNMFTGASTAWASLILVDAKRGLRDQTRRHASIAKLHGHEAIVFLVNKMDAVDFSESRFNELANQCHELAKQLQISKPVVLPISALSGDNVVQPSSNMTWWSGSTVLDVLTGLERQHKAASAASISIQVVLIEQSAGRTRRLLSVRFDGQGLYRGQSLTTQSGRKVTVAHLYSGGQAVDRIDREQDALIELVEEVDLTRGDWLFSAPTEFSKQMNQWSVGSQTTPAAWVRRFWYATAIVAKSRDPKRESPVDLGSLCYHKEVQPLQANSIGRITLKFAQALPSVDFATDRISGSLVIVDPSTRQTLAAGVIAPIPGIETLSEH